MADEIVATASVLKDYATLIAIPAAALVGSIAYRLQKSVDRKSALIELRRKAYTNYLDALCKLIADKSPENNAAYNSKLMELSAVASDEVVVKIGKMRNLFGSSGLPPNADKETSESILGDMVISMRKDCFQKSKLTTDDIVNITPFRF
jgi:hypothetical protein